MTAAVIVALTMSMNWVLGVFGLWAIFSGLLQLGTAVRRWKTSGGRWAMMAFATKSIDPVLLRSNTALVAHAAAGFGASTVLTTVAEKTFSGPMFDEIIEAFPGQPMLDRTSMNTWEDAAVVKEINVIGKKRLVICGLWTSVCIVGSTLSAIDQGFEVYVMADACGDVSAEAHDRAIDRMVQAAPGR